MLTPQEATRLKQILHQEKQLAHSDHPQQAKDCLSTSTRVHSQQDYFFSQQLNLPIFPNNP